MISPGWWKRSSGLRRNTDSAQLCKSKAAEENRLKKVEIRIVVSAAIRAGHSRKTAQFQVSRLLRNVKVQAIIQAAIAGCLWRGVVIGHNQHSGRMPLIRISVPRGGRESYPAGYPVSPLGSRPSSMTGGGSRSKDRAEQVPIPPDDGAGDHHVDADIAGDPVNRGLMKHQARLLVVGDHGHLPRT